MSSELRIFLCLKLVIDFLLLAIILIVMFIFPNSSLVILYRMHEYCIVLHVIWHYIYPVEQFCMTISPLTNICLIIRIGDIKIYCPSLFTHEARNCLINLYTINNPLHSTKRVRGFCCLVLVNYWCISFCLCQNPTPCVLP
jgi:hypothetical protein